MGEVDPKLGELIKKTRLERRLTQEKVAELVDCHTQYYKNLENGIGMPSVPMFCKIMRVLNISADDYVYFVHQTIEKYPEIKKEILEYEKNIQEYEVDKAINHIGRFD